MTSTNETPPTNGGGLQVEDVNLDDWWKVSQVISGELARYVSGIDPWYFCFMMCSSCRWSARCRAWRRRRELSWLRTRSEWNNGQPLPWHGWVSWCLLYLAEVDGLVLVLLCPDAESWAVDLQFWRLDRLVAEIICHCCDCCHESRRRQEWLYGKKILCQNFFERKLFFPFVRLKTGGVMENFLQLFDSWI